MALQKFFICESLESADKACVVVVKLVSLFGAGNDSLGGVDYDYKVTHFLVGSVSDLILSANYRSGLGGDASERLSGGVNDEPLALLILFIYKNSFHTKTLKIKFLCGIRFCIKSEPQPMMSGHWRYGEQ